MKNSLAVIICATNIDKAFAVCENIRHTSGLTIEPLICNNTQNESICTIYNRYSKFAQSEYILLCHQDIKFIGQNWGPKIIAKLNEPTCGVIGFAGAKFRPRNIFSGWWLPVQQLNVKNIIQFNNNKTNNVEYLCSQVPFESVITVDGLAMFLKKSTLSKYNFDENNLHDFHCYDLDYSIVLSHNGLTNYVCTDKSFSVWHESTGKYEKSWLLSVYNITLKKWNNLTPLSTSDVIITDSIMQKCMSKNSEFIARINKHIDEPLKSTMIAKIKNIS